MSPLIRPQRARLRRGSCVAQAVNVVAVGRPGVGKRPLLSSVGHARIVPGDRVLWLATAQLVQRLLAAKRALRLPPELARLDRFACLILDDSGSGQHDQDELEVWFTLRSARDERKSVLRSTTLVCAAWTRRCTNPMPTVAASDRVVPHAVIRDRMGRGSYRATAATSVQQLTTSGAREGRDRTG